MLTHLKNYSVIIVPLTVLIVLALIKLTACGGGGSSSTPTPSPSPALSTNTFTNGGQTLTTSPSSTSDTKTVTVTDSSGTNVVTLHVTKTGVTMSAPGKADASMTFRQPLTDLPTDYTANRMAVYAGGIMTANAARADSPGCDWFPDTQCTLGCCADHDQCYKANNCGASSWVWGFGSDACKNCNNVVYDCIGAACTGVTESFTADNCFDAKCGKHYDCPPDFNNCTCKDVCADAGITVPTTCGDGVCVAGEDLDNCFTDCGMGTSASACCTAHSFPGETGSSCGAGVTTSCCCGQYYACDWHVNPASTLNQCVHSGD